MRVYIDNNIPYRFVTALSPRHDVRHARDLGWQKLLNGELMKVVSEQFDVMITVDKSMRFQTKISSLSLGVIVLDAVSNRLDDLLPFVPRIMKALQVVKAGEYDVIERP